MSATDPPKTLSRRVGRALVVMGCVLGAAGMILAGLGGALSAAEQNAPGGRGIVVNRLGLVLMFVAASLILVGLRLPWFASIIERLSRVMPESQTDAPPAERFDVFAMLRTLLPILAILVTLPLAALPATVLGVAAFPLEVLMMAWLTAIIVYDKGPARAFCSGAMFPLGTMLLFGVPILAVVANGLFGPFSYQVPRSVFSDIGGIVRWPLLAANLLAIVSGLGAILIRLICLLPRRRS